MTIRNDLNHASVFDTKSIHLIMITILLVIIGTVVYDKTAIEKQPNERDVFKSDSNL